MLRHIVECDYCHTQEDARAEYEAITMTMNYKLPKGTWRWYHNKLYCGPRCVVSQAKLDEVIMEVSSRTDS